MYTRRQLRVLYALGAMRSRYHEETVFGKLDETRGLQQLPPHTSNANDGERSRDKSNGGIICRASTSTGRASKARSHCGSCADFPCRSRAPRPEFAINFHCRAAPPRPKKCCSNCGSCRSGFETRVQFGITYQFGSTLASIVNPRFGQ